MDALLEMKEQLQVLKAKLDEQEIINDQLLRHVTQKLYAPADAGNHYQTAGGMAEKAPERPGTNDGRSVVCRYNPAGNAGQADCRECCPADTWKAS